MAKPKETTEIAKEHKVTCEYYDENKVPLGYMATDQYQENWYFYKCKKGKIFSVEKVKSPVEGLALAHDL